MTKICSVPVIILMTLFLSPWKALGIDGAAENGGSKACQRLLETQNIRILHTLEIDPKIPPLVNKQIELLAKENQPIENWYSSVTARGLARLQSLQSEVLEKFKNRSLAGLSDQDAYLLYKERIDQHAIADVFIKMVNPEIGYGVFARSRVKKGEMIGEYTGIVRQFDPASDPENAYLMSSGLGNSRVVIVIDAASAGNETRFINHSVQRPNCTHIFVFSDGKLHVLIIANKDIEVGEQLLYDYGVNYWQKRATPSEDL